MLVGDCPTIDDAEKLLHRVKKIHPKTLDGLPTIWGHRKGQGLKWAMVTQNPLIPAQRSIPAARPTATSSAHGAIPAKPGDTYDPFVAATAFEHMKKPDPLVERMNQGPTASTSAPAPSRCRSPNSPDGRRRTHPTRSSTTPRSSARAPWPPPTTTPSDSPPTWPCKSLPASIRPYVYHDRFTSKVCLGPFNGPDDPRLGQLQQGLTAIDVEILQKKYTRLPLAPAPQLMAVPRP